MRRFLKALALALALLAGAPGGAPAAHAAATVPAGMLYYQYWVDPFGQWWVTIWMSTSLGWVAIGTYPL
jgi:ABC-type sugar transport system substrate-binding protein